jgi:hypothetical protein
LVETKSYEFGDAKPGGEGQMQHGAISRTRDDTRIRSIKESPQLIARQIRDQSFVSFLHWDGMDLAGLVEAGREPVFQEAEERVDRGEPGIAGAGGVFPVSLKMCEKGEHKWSINLFHLELAGLDTKTARSEADQQLKAIGIGIACVWARRALGRQMFAQECREVGCEGGHATPP